MIIGVLILPVAIGLAALAVEGGLWYSDQHSLRAMADAGALAAGWAAREGENKLTLATEAAEELGFDDATDDIEVNWPPTEGAYAGDNEAYEVVITRKRPLIFAGLFMSSKTMDISVRAVSRSTTRSAYCVLALSSSASNAINFSGGPTVTLNGCGLNANSVADDALNLTGNSTVVADWAQARGEIDKSGRTTLSTLDPPEEHSFLRPDPFASLPTPAAPASTCASGQTSYSPCRFTGNVTFGSHDVVTLDPGTYWVDGSFRMNSGAQVTGSGVTLYFADGASVNINGGATLNLSAPTTGTYAGMAMMQSSTVTNTSTMHFNGGSTMSIQGAVYFPKQALDFNGGNSLGGNGCTRVVANTVTFSGNAEMGNNCSGLGLPTTLADEPQLVE